MPEKFNLNWFEHQIEIAIKTRRLSDKDKKAKLRSLIALAYEKGVTDARMDEDYYGKPR